MSLKFALSAVWENVTNPLLIFHTICGEIKIKAINIDIKNFLFMNKMRISFSKIIAIKQLIGKNKIAYLDKRPKENIIANKAEDYVILRLGALLGPYSNNLVCRVLNDISSQTTLDKDSTFNYVLYEDVLKFLRIMKRIC